MGDRERAYWEGKRSSKKNFAPAHQVSRFLSCDFLVPPQTALPQPLFPRRAFPSCTFPSFTSPTSSFPLLLRRLLFPQTPFPFFCPPYFLGRCCPSCPFGVLLRRSCPQCPRIHGFPLGQLAQDNIFFLQGQKYPSCPTWQERCVILESWRNARKQSVS